MEPALAHFVPFLGEADPVFAGNPLGFAIWHSPRFAAVGRERVPSSFWCAMKAAESVLKPYYQVLSPILSGVEAGAMEAELQPLFGEDPMAYDPETSLDDCLEHRRALVLLITPRSGSTHLCELMASTRQLGVPFEYAHWPYIRASGFARDRGVKSLQEYMRHVINECSSDSGIFSMKGDLYHFVPLIRAGLIRPGLKKVTFVYLTRRDLLAQATSLFRAVQTGRWSSLHQASGSVGFDAQDIIERVNYLAVMMARWETLFALLNIHPLRVSYEDVLSNAPGVVQQLGSVVGVSIAPDGLQSPLCRLRDEASAQWEEEVRTGAQRWIEGLGDSLHQPAANANPSVALPGRADHAPNRPPSLFSFIRQAVARAFGEQ